ncbi:MAG: cation:proton antiporter [Chitinispirillales bacterium]|jgi:Kef-type K+ transport system membrane component KefB/mannitol/fructose-specific phosphotransferase system IIA component (Ntr-type)|nr:cation:proton antiporter [Chitinispirillales bacterium]
MKKRLSISKPLLLLSVIPVAALASGAGGAEDVPTTMSRLVLQLGIIVLAARFAGLIIQKFSVPSVIIELGIGIIIGPYLLGHVALPGFPEGIFPNALPIDPETGVRATGIPVSTELYAIATIASIIMLFSAGLETDLTLLLRFSFTGVLVGAGGVIASFILAAFVVTHFFHLPLSHPTTLFIGVMCVSTSLGIVARILSEKRKMDSPEGVTILASAVIDDMLGIVALTVVTGFMASSGGAAAASGLGQSAHPFLTVGRAIAVWLLFTALGILFAGQLARAMKRFKSVTYISIVALGLALILAGIFQMAGLAMIIGAYVVGLSLSKTDLTDTVRDALEVVNSFFVPVFFVVMGMMVNVKAVMSRDVLTFGIVLSLAMIVSKVIGCGLPTLFFNFNRLGAIRIGMGMVPRGEVSFIIAGIGLSSGVLNESMFGAGVLMVLACAVVSPPIVSTLFGSPKKGVKKELYVRQTVSTPIAVPTHELTDLLELRVVQAFRSEGFFVHTISLDGQSVYHLRKNAIHITLHSGYTGLEFESDKKDVILVKAITHETLLHINDAVTGVKDLIKPEKLLEGLTDSQWRADTKFKDALSPFCIIPSLKAGSKQEVVEKLVGMLHEHGLIKKGHGNAVAAVMEREASMSTGMQYGVAMPHARTDAVEKITLAVGLSRTGINFDSLDGEPSKIFVLILSPESTDSPHIQVLANISALLNHEETRSKLLACNSQDEIHKFFTEGLGN